MAAADCVRVRPFRLERPKTKTVPHVASMSAIDQMATDMIQWYTPLINIIRLMTNICNAGDATKKRADVYGATGTKHNGAVIARSSQCPALKNRPENRRLCTVVSGL